MIRSGAARRALPGPERVVQNEQEPEGKVVSKIESYVHGEDAHLAACHHCRTDGCELTATSAGLADATELTFANGVLGAASASIPLLVAPPCARPYSPKSALAPFTVRDPPAADALEDGGGSACSNNPFNRSSSAARSFLRAMIRERAVRTATRSTFARGKDCASTSGEVRVTFCCKSAGSDREVRTGQRRRRMIYEARADVPS